MIQCVSKHGRYLSTCGLIPTKIDKKRCESDVFAVQDEIFTFENLTHCILGSILFAS